VAACNHLLKHQLAAAAPAANQQQKRRRGLHPLSAALKMYEDVAEPVRTPDSPVLSGRDQVYPILSSKFLNPLTAANAARQYNETVAIAGLLRSNCWIASSVGYDDAVFDESR
jgi:hypothetical protein